jgi:hypothetical protein
MLSSIETGYSVPLLESELFNKQRIKPSEKKEVYLCQVFPAVVANMFVKIFLDIIFLCLFFFVLIAPWRFIQMIRRVFETDDYHRVRLMVKWMEKSKYMFLHHTQYATLLLDLCDMMWRSEALQKYVLSIEEIPHFLEESMRAMRKKKVGRSLYVSFFVVAIKQSQQFHMLSQTDSFSATNRLYSATVPQGFHLEKRTRIYDEIVVGAEHTLSAYGGRDEVFATFSQCLSLLTQMNDMFRDHDLSVLETMMLVSRTQAGASNTLESLVASMRAHHDHVSLNTKNFEHAFEEMKV